MSQADNSSKPPLEPTRAIRPVKNLDPTEGATVPLPGGFLAGAEHLDHADEMAKTQEVPPETAASVRRAALTITVPDKPGAKIGAKVKTISAPSPDSPEAIANPFKLSLSLANRALLLSRLGLDFTENIPRIGHSRPATYLMLDAATVTNTENHQVLAELIKPHKDHPRRFIAEDDAGNLIIINFEERGGVETLFESAETIHNKIPGAKILLSECKVRKLTMDNFRFTDESLESTAPEDLNAVTPKFSASGTILSKTLADKMHDIESRVGSNIELTSTETPNPKYVSLVSAIPRVSKEQGGPDRVIGREDEIATLTASILNDEKTITCLEGKAGLGKSRIRTELIERLTKAKLIDGHALCSLNSSDENDIGKGLSTVATQLIKILESEFLMDLVGTTDTKVRQVANGELVKTGDAQTDNPEVTLEEFQQWSPDDRAQFTIKNPEIVRDLCLQALFKLREAKGPKTLFVLEDLHHADRMSLPHLLALVELYKITQGKSLITTRPEGIHQSVDYKDLKKDDQVSTITLSKLDMYRDPELGRQFAFYSLPEDVRRSPDGKDRELENWYRLFAKKANGSPLAMKNLMDQAKKALKITDDGKIAISEELENRVRQIGESDAEESDSSDLNVLFQEIVAKLPPRELIFLQCVALMQETLQFGHAMEIAKEVLGLKTSDGRLDSKEFRKLIDNLWTSGYINQDVLMGLPCMLQNEAMRPIVISSISDETTKVALATKLYGMFKKEEKKPQRAEDEYKEDDEDKRPPLKVRHSLASIVAANKPASMDEMGYEDAVFWTEYDELTRELFKDAEYRHANEDAFKIAAGILKIPKIQACIKSLQEGELIDENFTLAELTIEALIIQARSASFIGDFDATDKAVAILQTIAANNDKITINTIELNKIAFDKAYFTSQAKDLKIAYEKLEADYQAMELLYGENQEHKTDLLMMQIKLRLMQNKFAEAVKIYDDNKAKIEETANAYSKSHAGPSPIHLELRRICEARCPLEEIKKGQVGDGREFDSDVLMNPMSLSPEQKDKLAKIAKVTQELVEAIKTHPLAFNNFSEISLRLQQAEIMAFLGEYDAAIKTAGETWRIANDEMKRYDTATRVAKMCGQIQVTQAIAQEKPDLVKAAIATYTAQGIEGSLKQVNESDPYQYIMRVQRICAIGILALNCTAPAELEPYLAMALEDFTYLNTRENLSKMANDSKHPWYGTFSYYFMGYMSCIINKAEELSIALPEDLFDQSKYPYMRLDPNEKALDYAQSMTDLGLFGEVQRKIDGLQLLAQRLAQRDHDQTLQQKQARDSTLLKSPHTKTDPGTTVLRNIGSPEKPQYVIVDDVEVENEELEAKIEKIDNLGTRLAALNGSDPSDSLKTEIVEAIADFKELNKKTENPATIYRVLGSISYIILAAENMGISYEEILDEKECPWMNPQQVKNSYKYAQKLPDFGDGLSNQKLLGIAELMKILRFKQQQTRAAKRIELDLAEIEKRQTSLPLAA